MFDCTTSRTEGNMDVMTKLFTNVEKLKNAEIFCRHAVNSFVWWLFKVVDPSLVLSDLLKRK